jgi:hypothetical protein
MYEMKICGRKSNSGGAESFRSRLDRPSSPPSLLYNDFVSFLGVKKPGRRVDHSLPSRAQVKEESFSYTSTHSPCVPSQQVIVELYLGGGGAEFEVGSYKMVALQRPYRIHNAQVTLPSTLCSIVLHTDCIIK